MCRQQKYTEKIKRVLLSSLLLFSGMLFINSCAAKNELTGYLPQADILARSIRKGEKRAFQKDLTAELASSRTKENIPLTVLAAACGEKEILKLLLEKGAFADARDGRNNTALHVAAGREKDFDIVKLLLENGADKDAAGYYGKTPLMEAGRCGNIKAFTLLLKKGADVNKKDALGRTPLMYVCMGAKEQVQMVKLLLEKGALPDEADKQGKWAVVFASERKYTESAKLLLEKYPSFTLEDEEVFFMGLAAMHGAVKSSDKTLVRYLLDKKFPLNWDKHTFQIILGRINSSGIYRTLARNELLDVKRAPLLLAAKENNLEMVKFFLEAGANIWQEDEKGYEALDLAKDRAVIAYLKKAKAKALDKNSPIRKEKPVFQGKLLGN